MGFRKDSYYGDFVAPSLFAALLKKGTQVKAGFCLFTNAGTSPNQLAVATKATLTIEHMK